MWAAYDTRWLLRTFVMETFKAAAWKAVTGAPFEGGAGITIEDEEPDPMAPLNEIRRRIDAAWPDDCCVKQPMHESNGKVTMMCDSRVCSWSRLYLALAVVMVDEGIRLKKPV